MNATFDLTLNSRKALARAYMPYVKNGGLFVATSNQEHQLNDSVQLNVTLMDEVEPFFLEGEVVWINPPLAQGDLPEGIGVQFKNQKAAIVRAKIENYLADYVANELSATM